MKSNYRLTIIFFLFLGACNTTPYVSDYTTNKPQLKDLPGTYRFLKQTVRDSTTLQDKSAVIELKPDGTFKATNIPDYMRDSSFKRRPQISAAGKWKLEQNGSLQNFWGNRTTYWGINFSSLPESVSNFALMGNSEPYQLIINYDDPDLGEVMIFSKSNK